MDDLITGANIVEEIEHIQREIHRILISGGFPMRKWTSNTTIFQDGSSPTTDDQTLGEPVKTLGLY